MVQEDQGAVVASLLALAGGDSVLYDNIHPTTFGTMLMGYSWAKAIASHVSSAKNSKGFTTLPKHIFVGTAGDTARPQYTVEAGTFSLMWYLSRNTETWANGTLVGTLPTRFRPAQQLLITGVCTDASTVPLATAHIKISDDGAIRVYNIDPATVFLSFSASWRI